MHKPILEALKAKFTGVSEQILSRIAAKMAKTVTTSEQVQGAVDAMTLQQVIDSYADSRATEATHTAVQNYETKHGLKDGVKIPEQGAQSPSLSNTTTPPTGGAPDATQQLIQQLLDQNKKLTERLDRWDGERTTADRKKQISEIVSKLPENLRSPYGYITVDSLSEEQFNELKGKLTTEVDGLAQALNSKGAVFGRPQSTQGGSSSETLSKEQEEAIAQRNTTTVSGDKQPF